MIATYKCEQCRNQRHYEGEKIYADHHPGDLVVQKYVDKMPFVRDFITECSTCGNVRRTSGNKHHPQGRVCFTATECIECSITPEYCLAVQYVGSARAWRIENDSKLTIGVEYWVKSFNAETNSICVDRVKRRKGAVVDIVPVMGSFSLKCFAPFNLKL